MNTEDKKSRPLAQGGTKKARYHIILSVAKYPG
jgi:hypothetical protein